MTRRSAAAPLVAGLLVVASLLGSGCGKDEFQDRTARVTVDGEGSTFTIDSCGLDEETIFVVGRADDGRILQAVVGVRGDDRAGVPDSSGLTVDDGTIALSGFGSEAWTRRGESGAAPGRITSARLRGSRIQVTGDLVPVTDEGRPVERAEPVAFAVDVRCDDQSER